MFQGTDIEMYCPHVITDQILVACRDESGASWLIFASIDKIIDVAYRDPDPKTVSIGMNGFHKEGIPRVQAFFRAGSGVLRACGIQACYPSQLTIMEVPNQSPNMRTKAHTDNVNGCCRDSQGQELVDEV